MEYILFSFLVLFASAGNTIFNRLGSNKASALTNAVLKSFYIVIACFLITLSFGHVPVLYSLSLEQWLWILLIGALTAIDWFFYFLAIQKSHLEAFAPFCAAGIIFTSNTLFSIFTFALVTNGNKPLNIVLYILGLVSLLGSLLFIVFNKQVNPKAKKLWVLYAVISVVSYSFALLVVKLKLSDIPSDIISFHQMCIVFVTMLLASTFTLKIKETVSIRWVDHLYIFIGAVFNALMIVFKYRAFSYANAQPAVINMIVGLDFVLVSLGTIMFFTAKNKIPMLIIITLVVIGMLLDVLAGII